MPTTILNHLSEITPAAWNRLIPPGNPFLRHEFLAALERNHCVGDSFGWYPQHITLTDDHNNLLAAMPLYLKDNSYGEFVFDWSWAEAYQQAGLNYYPKLVSAIPYTPASGPRLLCADPHNQNHRETLIRAALALAEKNGASSCHWLFPAPDEAQFFEQMGLLKRTDCQFHWHNRGYKTFDDFLATFTAHKRKKIRRERRRVAESGISIEVIHGHEASETQWHAMHHFYQLTFNKKWGHPTLNLPFFLDIAEQMGEQIVLTLARNGTEYVAGALNFRSNEVLYGRHWGCIEHYRDLHFEVCYYQGIEYCIEQGLSRFEPGVQGEYKVSRGFEPCFTHSYHWIENPMFRKVIADFLEREARHVALYHEALNDHLPFKQSNGL